jgi:ATP-dependent DNA ligase
MAPNQPPPAPADPLEWRPMKPLVTRRPLTIRDPVVEPLWSGTRVIAHIHADEPTRLIDTFGIDLAESEPALLAELLAGLATAVQADDAVIDAVLTDEATRSGEGAAIISEPRVSLTAFMMKQDPGVEVQRKDINTDPIEAFVALDLLWLDGRSLLDVPLLERKRLLESVVIAGDLVRVSVHARPPVEAWVASWKSAGLLGGMLKAANSRYVPGTQTAEWRTVTRVAGRR